MRVTFEVFRSQIHAKLVVVAPEVVVMAFPIQLPAKFMVAAASLTVR